MDGYEIRKGANIVFYDIPSEVDWYFKRGGSNEKLLKRIGKEWTRMMAPFTPHISEELGQLWDIEYVNKEELTAVNEDEISKTAEAEEDYIKDTRDDIRQILNVADVEGDKIYLYTAPEWKEDVLQKILQNPDAGMGIMSTLVKEVDAPSDKLSSFTQEVLTELKGKGEKDSWNIEIDEFSVLNKAKEFLEDEFEAEIEVQRADDEEKYDPIGKSKQAMPRKPAIYVE